MKAKISVSLDEKTILGIFKKLDRDRFKNKSQVVEIAIKRFLRDENGRT